MFGYAYGAYGAMHSAAAVTPALQSGPHACLRKSSEGAAPRAWCGREPGNTEYNKEYVFQDADYAAEHYDRRDNARMHKGVPAACEKCVDAMRAERDKEESGRKK